MRDLENSQLISASRRRSHSVQLRDASQRSQLRDVTLMSFHMYTRVRVRVYMCARSMHRAKHRRVDRDPSQRKAECRDVSVPTRTKSPPLSARRRRFRR